VRNFGSFETIYAELVEPWLGSWAELRRTYARFKAGEITEEQGAEEIRSRVAKAAEATTGEVLPRAVGLNQHTGEDRYRQIAGTTQQARAKAAGISTRTQRTLDRLAKVRPDLLDEVKAGHLSAHRAALEAKIVKPLDPYDQLLRLWGRLSPEQRARFRAHLSRQQEDTS
jgi:hypothetical protein